MVAGGLQAVIGRLVAPWGRLLVLLETRHGYVMLHAQGAGAADTGVNPLHRRTFGIGFYYQRKSVPDIPETGGHGI